MFISMFLKAPVLEETVSSISPRAMPVLVMYARLIGVAFSSMTQSGVASLILP